MSADTTTIAMPVRQGDVVRWPARDTAVVLLPRRDATAGLEFIAADAPETFGRITTDGDTRVTTDGDTRVGV